MEYKLIVYMLAMLEHIATLLLKRASALVEELSKNSGGNTKPVITCKYIKIARNYHEVFTPPSPLAVPLSLEKVYCTFRFGLDFSFREKNLITFRVCIINVFVMPARTESLISSRVCRIRRRYSLQELRKLFADERRGTVMKPALRTEPAQTYEEVE